MRRRLSFLTGCLLELVLLLIAWVGGLALREPFLRHCHLNLSGFLLGTLGAVPPFLFFLWTLKSRIRVFSRHRRLMDNLLRPLFGHWSVVQLLVLSIIAGVS